MCVARKKISVQINPSDLTKNRIMTEITLPKQARADYENTNSINIMARCGVCHECKLENARNWTYKVWLESFNYVEKCFLTLTYANNNAKLNRRVLQLFLKRLRKSIEPKKIKYFYAGEYGEKKGRPHYHMIILGWQPKDLKNTKIKSKRGHDLYTSNTVRKLWQNQGAITVQPFKPNEIGYITNYLNINAALDNTINEKSQAYKKALQIKVKKKYGLIGRVSIDKKNFNYNKQIKILKRVKDLDKETFKKYKKDYNKAMAKVKHKKEPEFNGGSKGMGFQNYLDKEYYKYDLNIDGFKYERPREYLRKIIENPNDYPEDVLIHTIKELQERKKHVEENYVDPFSEKDIKELRAKEHSNYLKNEARKKLYKTEIKTVF